MTSPTTHVYAWTYPPGTSGLVLGKSRLGAANFGAAGIPGRLALGTGRLGTSKLSPASTPRAWVDIDPNQLAHIDASYGLKPGGVPLQPDVGTLTATWRNGGDPDMHPGIWFGSPIKLEDDAAGLLWAGRITRISTTETRNGDTLTTWTAADGLRDLAGVRWPAEGLAAAGATATFTERASQIVAGPPAAPNPGATAARRPWSPAGAYETALIGSAPDQATSVELLDAAAAGAGAVWWVQPAATGDPAGGTGVQIGTVLYAHPLDTTETNAGIPGPAIQVRRTYTDTTDPSYTAITLGLATDEVINLLELKGLATSATSTVTDPTSIQTYGAHAGRYDHLAASQPAAETAAAAYLTRTAPSAGAARRVVLRDPLVWFAWGTRIWDPIDVTRRGRTTRARIGRITYRITPDHRADDGQQWAVTLDLIERTTP